MYSVSLLSQGVEELAGKEEQVSYILYCFVKTDSSVQLRRRVWESGCLTNNVFYFNKPVHFV